MYLAIRPPNPASPHPVIIAVAVLIGLAMVGVLAWSSVASIRADQARERAEVINRAWPKLHEASGRISAIRATFYRKRLAVSHVPLVSATNPMVIEATEWTPALVALSEAASDEFLGIRSEVTAALADLSRAGIGDGDLLRLAQNANDIHGIDAVAEGLRTLLLSLR